MRELSRISGIINENSGIMFRFFLILVFFLSVSSFLKAQTSKIITVADTTQGTVGDQIHLTLQAVYPTGKYVSFEEIGDTLGEFEVLKQELSPVEEYTRWSQRDLKLTLTVWDTGHYRIPPVKVKVFNPEDTADVVILKSRPVDVLIFSVLSDKELQLRDIKPPFDIPFLMPWVWVVLGLIALGAAVGGILFRKWWVKTHPKISIDPYYLLPPHERAFRRLKKLEEGGMPSPPGYEIFFTELSEIFREYLEGRYFIRALEMSTPEILDLIPELPIGEDDRFFIKEFLEISDLVKFARFIPGEEMIRSSFKRVKDFIERTKLIIGEWKAIVEEEESYDRSSQSG